VVGRKRSRGDLVKLWFRILYVILSWRTRPKLTIDEVSKITLRVWPTDLDIYNHMNNGIFLTLMDIGRFDQGLRTGFWQQWNKKGWFPIVVNSTISYRKALLPWQKFTIETKVIGWDDVAYYIEQRFVRDGEIYARAIMRGRFLKRAWGTLTPQEVMEGSGGWPGERPRLPNWVEQWAKDCQLPKGKEPAPSNWD
jgi:acyl-CoA thioesterase FadM